MEGSHLIGKFLGVLLILFAAFHAWASEPNVSGRWEAHIMGSRIEARIDQNRNRISGVAYIFDPFGKKDTYHFQGHIQGGRIQVAHGDGHVFSGSLTQADQLVGVIRAASGRQVAVTASRR